MNELKRQCHDLIRSRAVECNLIVNKPPIGLATSTSKQADMVTDSECSAQQKSRVAGGGKQSNLTQKGSKNLQFAKELNAEIELMFADDDFQIKPNKSKVNKRKEARQKQVQLAANKKQVAHNAEVNGLLQSQVLL